MLSDNPDPRFHFIVPDGVLGMPQVLSNTPGYIVANVETRRIRPLIESTNAETGRHRRALVPNSSVSIEASLEPLECIARERVAASGRDAEQRKYEEAWQQFDARLH